MANTAALETAAHLVVEFAGNHANEVAAGLSAFIRAAESRGRDSEMVVVLLQESTDLLTERAPRGGGLTEEQARYLIESGDFTEEELAETEREVASGVLAEEERKTRLGAITRSLSAAEVAKLLHIDASRVRHRQAKGLLYSFMVGGKRRYPEWQFVDGEPLPNLAQLVAAFPTDWHPAGVESFMTTPKSSLRAAQPTFSVIAGSGPDRLTPVEWLQSGGDAQAVVDILDSFLQS